MAERRVPAWRTHPAHYVGDAPVGGYLAAPGGDQYPLSGTVDGTKVTIAVDVGAQTGVYELEWKGDELVGASFVVAGSVKTPMGPITFKRCSGSC